MIAWLKKAAWPIAMVLAVLAYLFRGGRPEWTDRDQRQADAEAEARGEAIDERRKRKEAEALAELDKKRGLSRADRIAGALDRFRARLERGEG